MLHSRLITGIVTRLTRRVSLVEQELLTLPQHLSSPPNFGRVRVTRSLVLYVWFCRSLFVLLYFFFWPLFCLLYFDLRILITPLVSPNYSYTMTIKFIVSYHFTIVWNIATKNNINYAKFQNVLIAITIWY